MRIKNLLGAAVLGIFSLSLSAQGYGEREEAIAFARDLEARHQIPLAETLSYLTRATYDDRVIRYISPPKKTGVRSWLRYRSRFIEPIRIQAGIDFWESHRAIVRAAAERFGVDEAIIVGIIGVETIYGRYTGNFQVLDALATLAFDYPPRAELFRNELEALLLLARESHRDPLAYTGSYAGALGMPQFLPSSIRNWGLDFDGDGRVDLAASTADAIGSVANFLASHGWETDGPIAAPASVSGERFGELVDAGILPRYTPAEMSAYGVSFAADAPQLPCALIDLVTPNEATEYWLGYRNFYVITRYNRSSFYAMAVHALSRELKAGREAQLAGD